MKQLIQIAMVILAALVTTQAQDAEALKGPEFKVSINPDSILMGNRFTVTFSLENVAGQNFQAPSFNDFQVLSGPNQSSSFSMVNGAVSQSLTYTYYLEPKDIGNYYIEAASIDTDEKPLYTLPVEVVILANPDGIIQEPARRQRNFNFFSQPDFSAPRGKVEPKAKPKKKRKIYRI